MCVYNNCPLTPPSNPISFYSCKWLSLPLHLFTEWQVFIKYSIDKFYQLATITGFILGVVLFITLPSYFWQAQEPLSTGVSIGVSSLGSQLSSLEAPCPGHDPCKVRPVKGCPLQLRELMLFKCTFSQNLRGSTGSRLCQNCTHILLGKYKMQRVWRTCPWWQG